MSKTKIIINGGGPCGLLLSLYLSQLGFFVEIYEKRPRPLSRTLLLNRAANLDISARGRLALKEVGLCGEISSLGVPTYGRAIHDLQGNVTFRAYDLMNHLPIYSIPRELLNKILLDKVKEVSSIQINFEHTLVEADIHNNIFLFKDIKTNKIIEQRNQLLFGCDGAFSILRESLNKIISNNAEVQPFGHSYKQIHMSSDFCQKHLLHNYMHKWPRNNFTLVAHPNFDGSFTGNLILPNEGENSFFNLKTDAEIFKFFSTNFVDLMPMCTELIHEFRTQPITNMSTIRVKKPYYNGTILLLGDAAHAMLPFLGQGVNCALQDCQIFNQMLKNFENDFEKLFPLFVSKRVRDTDAILEMSANEYKEFNVPYSLSQDLLSIKIEEELVARFLTYIPYHNLIWFESVPYSIAKLYQHAQNKLTLKIISEFKTFENINWLEVTEYYGDYEKEIRSINFSSH